MPSEAQEATGPVAEPVLEQLTSAGGRRSAAGGAILLLHPAAAAAAQGLKETVGAVLHGFNSTVLAYGQTVRSNGGGRAEHRGRGGGGKARCPAQPALAPTCALHPRLPTRPGRAVARHTRCWATFCARASRAWCRVQWRCWPRASLPSPSPASSRQAVLCCLLDAGTVAL